MPRLGLLVTHTATTATLRTAAALMRADGLKVVTSHGLAGGWTPAAIADAAAQSDLLVARPPWGDPHYGGPDALEDYRYPFAGRTVDSLSPWYRVKPDVVGELGNEPRLTDDMHVYAYHLGEAITACRSFFPTMRLLGPAFSLNDPADDPAIGRWLSLLAPLYHRCAESGGGVAIHAYTADQLRRAIALVRAHVGPDIALWLTEVNLGEDGLSEVDRGRRIWDLVRGAPIAAAFVYHLDESDGPARPEQGPDRYRLSRDTLAALSLRDEAPRPAAPPTTAPSPSTPRLRDLGVRDLRPRLPEIKTRRPKPRQGRPTSVTLHYNGPAVSGFGNPEAELRHVIQVDVPNHQSRLAADSLQYHVVVTSDGAIYQTRDLSLPAAHCGEAHGNQYSLAVHLPLGGTQDATPAQWTATCRLFEALITEYEMPNGRQAVRGHDEWKATLCPGPNLKRRLLAWRAGTISTGGMYKIRLDVAAANVREGPGRNYPVALGGKAQMWPGDTVEADALVVGEVIGGDPLWLHRRDGVGFVHRSLVVAIHA